MCGVGSEGTEVMVQGGIWSGGESKVGYEHARWDTSVWGGLVGCKVGHKAARWVWVCGVGYEGAGGTRARGRAPGRAPRLNKSPLPLEGAEPLK